MESTENRPFESAAIVVGGGPAGLFAALRLAAALRERKGAGDATPADGSAGAADAADSVVLLEKRGRPARKLLLSGSGQCNITHAGEVEDFLPRYGRPAAGRFLKRALYGFTNEDLLDWFRTRGIEFQAEEGGKVFPASRRAADILAVLQAECGRLGIRIETGLRVESVARAEGEGGYLVRATRQTAALDAAAPRPAAGEIQNADPARPAAGGAEYRASILLLATGGASYPATGSSGDGYEFARSLGHRVMPPRPALAPVYVRGSALKSLAGLSFRGAGLSIRRGGKRVASFDGDLLITHEGFSGPLVLDASRDIEAGDLLELRFVDGTAEAFRDRLDEELRRSPRSLARTVLAQAGLPKSMAELFARLAGLAEDARAAELTRAAREALCRLAASYPAAVERLGGFDEAMATAGGVDLSEIDPQTMESRIAPGLFFAGELLDVDGDSGGYNLQSAFSTGALAAKGMLALLSRRENLGGPR